MSEFLQAEAGVRQLHAHYTDAVWRKDWAAFGDCFTPDAEWRIAGLTFVGRDDIVAGLQRIMATANRVLVTLRNPQFTLGGPGCGIGRVYVTEQCTWTDKAPNTTIGRYYEHLVDGGDRWRFSWRMFQLLYKGPADLSGDFLDCPDYGPFPAMPPRDEPPQDTTRRS